MSGSVEFEQWAARERMRLEELFLKACAGQCLVLARARRWEECGALAARWLERAPLSSDAALYWLNALKAPGTRDAEQRALEAYERLAERLGREYDRAPDRAVAALAREIAGRLQASDATGEFRSPGAVESTRDANSPPVTSSAKSDDARTIVASATRAAEPVSGAGTETASGTHSPDAESRTLGEPPTDPSVKPWDDAAGETAAPYAPSRAAHRRPLRGAVVGGAIALAAAVAVVSLDVRAPELGPARSLLAEGVLEPRERLLVADFQSPTGDSALGAVVTEAFRIDLSQSPMVMVVEPASLTDVLTRMRRPVTDQLDPALAREVAVREGIKAVVSGEVAAAGSRYLLSARLVLAETGDVLAAYRETARDSGEIVNAVDRLSKRLRETVGESVKALSGSPPLERVTTSSLEALRKYTRAVRAADTDWDHPMAAALLEEAIAVDTGFAMAYRKLGVVRGWMGDKERAIEAMTKAVRHRDRLPDRERLLTLATYHEWVTDEIDKAAAAYRILLTSYPDDAIALQNLGDLYSELHEYEQAERLFRRAIELEPASWQEYRGLMAVQVSLGKRRDAAAALRDASKRFPDVPQIALFASLLASSDGDYRTAELHALALEDRFGKDRYWSARASGALAALAAVRGRLAEAERHTRDAMSTDAENGAAALYLEGATFLGTLDAWLRRAPAQGLREVEAALARYPLDSIEPLDRPALPLALFFARAGKPTRARDLLAQHEQTIGAPQRRGAAPQRHSVRGTLALVEGRPEIAMAEFRAQASFGLCPVCGLVGLGRAHELVGQLDSAIVVYERYVTTPALGRIWEDATELAGVYKRLAELYDQRGQREKAAHYYSRFIELWRDCDPELRPAVTEARRRLTQLNGESTK